MTTNGISAAVSSSQTSVPTRPNPATIVWSVSNSICRRMRWCPTSVLDLTLGQELDEAGERVADRQHPEAR